MNKRQMTTCNCDFCKDMVKCSEEWDKLIPETYLQLRMKDVIRRIERRNNIRLPTEHYSRAEAFDLSNLS